MTEQEAKETGLKAGTKVLTGTGDSGTEAISTGVFQAGDLMIQLGSTCYFVYLADRLISDNRVWPGTFIIPNTYSICAGTPLNDPFAKGMIFGLQLNHTREHIYKSVLEGIAYSIEQNLKIMEENGLPVKKIMAVGGGTKNEPWLQIIADVLGKSVHTSKVSMGAAYGDALMASLSAGFFDNWEELSKVIKPAYKIKEIIPNENTPNNIVVDERFNVFD